LLLQILSLSDTPAGQYILFLTDTYLSRLVRIEFIQKESKMAPSRPQKILSVIALAALKPITRSIGAFIGSGLEGIARYAPAIIAAYAVGIIVVFEVFKDPILRYKNA
jgi:hypothetical protein